MKRFEITKGSLLSKKALLLAVSVLVISAALTAAGIYISANQLTAGSEESAAAFAAAKSKSAEAVDLAEILRKSTVKNVYEKESIPAYSYDQVWEMDVSVPSGVTAEDLKLVTSGGLVGLEDSFAKTEQDYNINCLFVMAIASHESANGTICFRPNNMFGYGSKGFSSKAECIDVVARALANSYLAPGGGLYCGKRITDVNRRYAASSTWDEKVCRNMTRYYQVISAHHNEQLEKLE